MWLPALFGLAETAARLEDRATALEVEALLRPCASLPLMGSLAIVCFGATARSCGLAQRTYGALDAAVATLEDAVVQQRRLGHLPMVAITSADLAETLVRRGADADAARADFLLDAAIERGTAMGLDARVAAWHARRDPATAVGTAVRRGACWEFATGRETATIPDSTGARYLVTLLSHPGTDLAAVALAGAIVGSSSQPVIDDRARREYQGRIGEIERRPRCSRSGGGPRKIGTVARRHGCAPRRDSPGRAPRRTGSSVRRLGRASPHLGPESVAAGAQERRDRLPRPCRSAVAIDTHRHHLPVRSGPGGPFSLGRQLAPRSPLVALCRVPRDGTRQSRISE